MLVAIYFIAAFAGFAFMMNSHDKVEIEKEKTKRKCCGGGCHEEKNDD